jgi:phosphoadenosine phosphosulfate reductase
MARVRTLLIQWRFPMDSFPMLELRESTEPTAQDVLRWVYSHFRRVAIVTSFQAESSVIIDMASKLVPRPIVVTLDTGRLPEATHRLMDEFQRRYPIDLRVVLPDPEEVRAMVAVHGPNLFYDSVALRVTCCGVRKSAPLSRVLTGFDAWVSGVRREQSSTRRDSPVIAADPAHGDIIKITPLAAWSKAQVWDYIERNEIPVHPLYTEGYTSIGCAPCTRPTFPGEDERAGRWSWETGAPKECGLHFPAQVPQS